MAKDTGVHFYKVMLNGVVLRKGFMGAAGKQEAERMAERWQGSHSQGKGLLKHKDKGDYVEVRRDYEGEKDYAERIDVAQRGNPQRIVMEYDSEYTP